MGVQQSTTLNTDQSNRVTTGDFADAGDTTSRWFHWFRSADGAHATDGATDDAAITDPATAATKVSILKGLLTFLRVSAAGLGKAEDAAHVSGDTGVQILAVRKDTRAVSSGTTGDYEPLQTNNLGELRTIDGRIHGYPAAATPVAASSGNVANAAAIATLPATASVTNYIAGFEITAAGSTAGLAVTVTLVGILGGTMSYTFVAPAGVLVPAPPLVVEFATPIPASAANVAIVVTCPALGAGNTNATANAHGFRV